MPPTHPSPVHSGRMEISAQPVMHIKYTSFIKGQKILYLSFQEGNMFQRDQLVQIIRDNIGSKTRDLQPRHITLPTDLNRVITLTGARRTGKTSLFWQTIGLLRQEMAADRILYLNLEDDRLFHLDLADLDSVLEIYFALYPANRERVVYLFFDESYAL